MTSTREPRRRRPAIPISRSSLRDPRAVAVLSLLVLTSCGRQPSRVPDPRPIAVRTERVVSGPFQPTLTLLGTVHPATVRPLSVGDGGTIHYPERFASGLLTGAAVTAGEHLATLVNPRSDLELTEARLDAESKSAELARVRRSFDSGLQAESELERFRLAARLAQERLAASELAAARLRILAPVDGLLLVDDVVPPGAEMVRGATLASIAGAGPQRIECRAAASDRSQLRPGLAVRIDGTREGTEPSQGSISEVAGTVDAAGTLRVVIVVDDDDSGALPGLGEGVTVSVELTARSDAITVPQSAIVTTGGGPGVFVTSSSGPHSQARLLAIETGADSGERIEVRRGLEPGARLVVAGAALLSDGSLISDTSAEEPR